MIQFKQESIDEEFDKGFEKLNEFSDVQGIFELRDLITSYKTSNRYKFVGENIKVDLSQECFDNSKKIPLISYAKKELGSIKFLIGKSNISFTSFIGLCSVIAFSCACDFNRDLTYGERIKVLNSSLIPKLTLAQEDFEDLKTWNLDKKFFKSLSEVKWDNRAKKLHKTIRNGCWFAIQLQHMIERAPNAQFGFCARYLASSHVLTHNFDKVMPENIINGWLLTFKIFDSDLRHYIFE